MHIEKHAATIEKKNTTEVYAEALPNQQHPKCIEADPYIRCNKLVMRAGKTQEKKVTYI